MKTGTLANVTHRGIFVVSLCVGAAIQPGNAAADLATTLHFEIPPQTLPSALLEYSEQSGVQVTGSGQVIESKQSPGVVGIYAAQGALEQILAGTNLVFKVFDANTVAIVSPPSASNVTGNSARSTHKSSHEPTGRWLWRRVRLSQAEPSAASNGATSFGSDTDSSLVAEVVVTGTRRSDIAVLESATPVDVVTATQLERQGFTDTNDLLRAIVPSLNAKTFSVDSFAVAVRPFSLRGLSPDQTLVLVNGKRWHRSPLVQLSRLPLSSGSQGPDLATIPSIALERVEVLRDGAAAQYGSDAIAGVVNFQLKRGDEGGQIAIKSGQYYEGDGESYQVQSNVGLPLWGDGFANISTEYSRSKYTQRGTQRADAAALIAAGNTAIANPAQQIGEPSNESESAFLNLEQPLAAGLTGYLVANFTNHEVEAGQFFRNPRPNGSRRDIFASVPLTSTPGGPRFSFASLFPGGLLPVQTYHVRDASGTGGIKGQLGAVSYDFSGSLSRGWSVNGVKDTVNPSLGPTAPTSYLTSLQEQRETQLHGDFVYEWDAGVFATPVSVAFGGEYREETFRLGAGDPDSYRAGPFARVFDPDTGGFVGLAIGSSAAPGTAPEQAGQWSRSNGAAYLDLEADVAERWSLGLAGRYEDFSDFGDTFNWKASSRFKVFDWLAVRGSYNTGFRAPTPGQSHISAQANSIDPATGALRVIATVPVDSPAAAYFGAKPLDPEESKNYSLGTVLDFENGLSLTLDYFHVEIEDRIGVTSNITISAADRAALAAQGIDVNQLTAVGFFANAFDTRTEGFDAVLAKSWMLGGYRVGLTAAYNRTETEVTNITFAPAVDRERQIEIGTYYPKWRATLTGTVDYGSWGLSTVISQYGKYTDAVPVVTAAAFDQTFGEETLVDLEVSFEVSGHLRLVAGGSNIFDNYPDREGLLGNRNNGFVYTQNSPFGYNGGFWYLRAGYTF